MEIMESCIPKQVITRIRNVPWLSQYLIRRIRNKNSVFRAVRKSCCPQKCEKYKKLRNEVVSLMREAKTSYFARIDPSSPKSRLSGI